MARLHSDLYHGQVYVYLFYGVDYNIDPCYGGRYRRVGKSASCTFIIDEHIREIQFSFAGDEFSFATIINKIAKEAEKRLSRVLKSPVYSILNSDNLSEKEGYTGHNSTYKVEFSLYERC